MVILTGLAFTLLLVGVYLLSRHLYVWDAMLFIALSLVVFSAQVLRRSWRHGLARTQLRTLLPRRVAGWMRVAGLGISTLVSLSARTLPVDSGYERHLILWLFSVLIFGFSILAQLLRQTGFWWRACESEKITLGLLLVVAGLLRGVAVGRIPFNLGGDEGTQLVAALDLLNEPLGSPFATGWYSVPTMSFFAYGLGMKVFGATLAGARMLSVIVGTLTVAAVYLLGRRLSGGWVGLLAAAMVAVSAYHIHFSRLASNQIFDPLIGVVTLWLVCQGLGVERHSVGDDSGWFERPCGGLRSTSGRRRALDKVPSPRCLYLGLAGMVAGFGWYFYFGSRWVTVLAALLVGWRLLAVPAFVRRYWQGLLLFALGWFVVVLPLLGWYSVHPSPLTERYRAVSIFASGWLAREVELTGRRPSALLLEQAWRSITAFHLTPDRTFWYFPQRPLLDFITGSLLLVGIVEAVVRIRWPSRSLVVIWLSSTLVMAWVLTESPPSSQRGLLMVPAVAFLAAWGMVFLSRALFGCRQISYRLAVPVILAIALLNSAFYFGVYTPRRSYGNPTAEIATAFARYTRLHPEPVCPWAAATATDCEGKVYFLGPPRLRWDFGALRFLLRDFPGVDVPDGDVPLEVADPARFAFVPERAYQLVIVEALYPGGQSAELTSPDGRLLMVLYDWPGPDA